MIFLTNKHSNHIDINVFGNFFETLQNTKMLCVLSAKKCCMVLKPVKIVRNLLVNTNHLLKKLNIRFSNNLNNLQSYTYKSIFLKSHHTYILILSILSYLYYRYECSITFRGVQ